ncbi:phiSA1p31-related protein [Streptomyces sp. NPDC056508]|uniref:phiSA1p31-related protein n=1 Tax=Streptomyces sp. NPDC056508 TaxID=3345845 RepID=UPI0036ABE0FE
MAHAQYETRTRTVEETVVVLTMSEDEADELRRIVNDNGDSPALYRVHAALQKPEPPKAEAPSTNTFELDGVTYEIGVVYRDAEGDCFRFDAEISPDGSPYGRLGSRLSDTFGSQCWTLREVAGGYGPLTKVTE